MSHGTFGRARHRQSGPGAISTVTAVGPTGRARHRREGPPDVVPVPAGVLLPGTPPQVRWREGQRLEGLFEATCDALAASGLADRLAVDGKALSLTYGQLDERANRLARYLAERGVRAGDRIALLFDQPVRSYTALLAVLKARAAFVPLDPGFPDDRLAYIIADAGAGFVLTLSGLRGRVGATGATVICLDEEDPLIAAQDSSRPEAAGPDTGAELAYIIYTSGSTGRPKGVAVEHPAICNFVTVAAETYGYRPDDRVYQGMTIAFDFSMEEIWVPWMVGATLVPKPAGSSLLGMELGQFLREQAITAMCCVPTLLATLDEDLPDLRFLLVSGEACPKDLIVRWHRDGRRFLNVYGPTEATVTASWDLVHPDKPVTLGVPLPTYTAVILDPDEARALPPGETGEIGIAGIGLARGYVNREDLTAKAFIPDFLGIANNPSGRIYRTGDLGRFTPEGTIEYLGRIDTQVKIRGYRIELTEIESVLLQHPAIAQAVVDTYKPAPGITELAAWYSLRHDAEPPDPHQLQQHLRERLPAYMVPAYLEHLAAIPMLPSDKADRKNLPAPTGNRITGNGGDYQPPVTETETLLAEQLAAVLNVERVSATAHFFEDLGMNSLLMANLSAAVRRQGGLPPVAVQDMYQNPDIRRLAAVLDEAKAPAGPEPAGPAAGMREPHRATGFQYAMCGLLQLAVFLAYSFLAAAMLIAGYEWAAGGSSWWDTVLRSLGMALAVFFGLGTLPILLKWVLIGRWKPQEIPIWTLRYVRFWFVKTLLQANPFQAFVATPLYPLYLRALGARIGRRVTFLSSVPPVCADLLTVGDDTVLRRGVVLQCHRARAGRLELGPVTLGSNVYVGERTVLDIRTSMGDGAQLGHSSSLHAGQHVPAGQSWHGSPARRAATDYRVVEPVPCTLRRRIAYSLWVIANRLFLMLTLGFALAVSLLDAYLESGHLEHGTAAFYLDALLFSLVLFYGGLVTAFALVLTVPRLLSRFLVPGRTYPVYGFHYALQRTVARLTNVRLFMQITGDSSLVVHYLQALGYKQPGLVQTGSNYGVELSHDSPYLTTVGSGTMVSDGLAISNADFSSTSFRVSETVIGAKNFFGNNIGYPVGGRTGENCLFGTKVMVPIDGPLLENTGLLGSPPFEIPRSVERDHTFDELKTEQELRERLPLKNRHNAVTLAIYLNFTWFMAYAAILLASFGAASFRVLGPAAIVVPALVFLVFNILMTALMERAAAGFKRLVPTFCSIYDIRFWRHERFWKMMAGTMAFLNGTPFKPLIWRLLGVRVGKRLYDDGMDMPEKTIVAIGDYATINGGGSIIQCHSLEDGVFKMDGTTLGNDVTLGVGVFVHYGITMADGAELEADSFLMKGTEVPPGALYGGNPARQLAAAPASVREVVHGG